MIRVTTTAVEGHTFTARTPQGIVRQMKRTQWNAPERKGDYMNDVRERVSQMTGTWVRIGKCEQFLRDLEAAGLIKVEWDVTVQ